MYTEFFRKLLLVPERKPLTDEELKAIKIASLEAVLFNRITSKKWRASRLDDKSSNVIQTYIHEALTQNAPLKFVAFFGGFKQSHLQSAPHAEWAEVFTIRHMLELASHIESVYEAGVEFIFRADDAIMPYLNNYIKEDIEQYSREWRGFVAAFQSIIPSDRAIKLRYESVVESSPLELLMRQMEERYSQEERKFSVLPEDQQDEFIAIAYRNQCWKGEKDFSMFTEEERKNRARWSYIMGQAYLNADLEIAKDYFGHEIQVMFRKGVPFCIHYSTTSTSTIQFWVGEGFLIKKGDTILPTILSYNQQKNITGELVKTNEEMQKLFDLKDIRVLGR